MSTGDDAMEQADRDRADEMLDREADDEDLHEACEAEIDALRAKVTELLKELRAMEQESCPPSAPSSPA